jgi:hypothetical protein
MARSGMSFECACLYHYRTRHQLSNKMEMDTYLQTLFNSLHKLIAIRCEPVNGEDGLVRPAARRKHQDSTE